MPAKSIKMYDAKVFVFLVNVLCFEAFVSNTCLAHSQCLIVGNHSFYARIKNVIFCSEQTTETDHYESATLPFPT